MDFDYSSLSDMELSQMLKDYGVNVGPVNMATRKVYERKLHKLKTGESLPPARKYEPVANDEDDDEIQFKAPPVSQERHQPPVPNVMHRTPEPTQARLRRDPADGYTPHVDSRPSLNSARKTTLSYEPRKPAAKSSTNTTDKATSGGLPLWVKLSALAVVIILAYLIYSNMESNAITNIPKIPGKMEV